MVRVTILTKFKLQGFIGNVFPVEGSGLYQVDFSNISLTLILSTKEDMSNDISLDNRHETSKQVQVSFTVENLDFEASSSQVCQQPDPQDSTHFCTNPYNVIINQSTPPTELEVEEGTSRRAVEQVVFWRTAYSLASAIETPAAECLGKIFSQLV